MSSILSARPLYDEYATSFTSSFLSILIFVYIVLRLTGYFCVTSPIHQYHTPKDQFFNQMQTNLRPKTLQQLFDSQDIVYTYTHNFQQGANRMFVEDYQPAADTDYMMEIEDQNPVQQPIVEEYYPKKGPHSGFFNLIDDSSDNKQFPQRRDSSVQSFKIIVKNNQEFESDSNQSFASNSSAFNRKNSQVQEVVQKIQVQRPKQRETRLIRFASKGSKQPKEVGNPQILSRQEKIQKVREVGCNCKKTHCLKMYCECFHLQIFCGNNCSCKGCGNLEKTVYHDQAVIQALTRNPKAFQDQNIQTCFKLNVGLDQVKKGCKCKKTRCLKKYCECYSSGEKCGVFCKCEGCENSAVTGELVSIEIET